MSQVIRASFCSDQESLKEEIIKGRTIINNLSDENKKLKTQALFLKNNLVKYEQIPDKLTQSPQTISKPDNPSYIVLKQKIRQQQQEIDQLKETIEGYQRHIKITRINEMEALVQQYEEETQRLRGWLNSALDMKETDGKTQSRLLQCIDKITEQRAEIQTLQSINIKYEKQVELQSHDIKKLQAANNQMISEKGKLIQKHQEQVADITSRQQQGVVKIDDNKEILLKEIEDLMNKINKLECDNTHLVETIKQVKRDSQTKVNIYLSQLQNYQASLSQKDELIKLQEEKLDFYQKTLQSKVTNERQYSKKTMHDASTQIPQVHKTANKNDIQEISIALRFILRRKRIPQKQIPKYLFNQSFANSNDKIPFDYLRLKLECFPFQLTQDQSFTMASYLLSPEETSLLHNQQSSDPITLGILSSRVIHMINDYQVINLQEEGKLHTEITRKLLKQHQAIVEMVDQIKKSEKSTVPEGFCNAGQLLEASRQIFDIPLTPKQIDYIQQISFEEKGDALNIHLPTIFNSFNMNFIKSVDETKQLQMVSQTYFTYFKDQLVIPKAKYQMGNNLLIQNSQQQVNMLNSSGNSQKKIRNRSRTLQYKKSFVIFDYFKRKKIPKLSMVKVIQLSVQKQSEMITKIPKLLEFKQLESISLCFNQRIQSPLDIHWKAHNINNEQHNQQHNEIEDQHYFQNTKQAHNKHNSYPQKSLLHLLVNESLQNIYEKSLSHSFIQTEENHVMDVPLHQLALESLNNIYEISLKGSRIEFINESKLGSVHEQNHIHLEQQNNQEEYYQLKRIAKESLKDIYEKSLNETLEEIGSSKNIKKELNESILAQELLQHIEEKAIREVNRENHINQVNKIN